MEIELSEDLQHYKESIALGLTAKQLIFSILSIAAGALIVLVLHKRVGMTVSCYIATPVVAPLALAGFYNYNGLSFMQFLKKMIYFTFFNRPLVFQSADSVEELIDIAAEYEKEKREKEKAETTGKDDMKQMKKKVIRLISAVVAVLTLLIGFAVYWKLSRQ